MSDNEVANSGYARLLVMAALLAVLPTSAGAQTPYPNRTVKIVVPAPPGANLDTIPRIIADKLSTQWGHPVIIEHRPGAAQNLGAEAVARSEPDGYTLLATPQGPLVISQHFFAKLGFDPTAFTPVSVIASQPLVLVAHPRFRASSLKELVAAAKSTARNNFLIAALWSETSLVFPALQMLEEGYGVYAVEDASGGTSKAAHDAAIRRIEQAGAVSLTALQVLLEFQRDWSRKDHYEEVMAVVKEHCGAYGQGIEYAATMVQKAPASRNRQTTRNKKRKKEQNE